MSSNKTHSRTKTGHTGAHVCCASEHRKCETTYEHGAAPCRVIWAAVFDGHAGKQVAALASKQLYDNVVSSGFLDAPVSYCCLSACSMTASMMLTRLYTNV